MLYPILDLVLTCHSDLTAIRHDSLREITSPELFHRVHLASSFPQRAITVDLVYFLLRVSGQSLSVCVRASMRNRTASASNDVQEFSAFRGSDRSIVSLNSHH
jgi:hypothetical protein